MRIEWINHASFVLEYDETRLLCDPWIEGYAFDNSWALLSPTKFTYGDFSNITHIWFGHEHSDHFRPPNLMKIPPECRKSITVLFQTTKDGRVVNFCRGLGFRDVIEMSQNWYALPGGMQLLCRSVGRGDSWLAMKAGGRCLLNLNDCIYPSEEDLRPVKEVIGDVDVLLTQFSYASWWGNEEDAAAWQEAARDTLEKIRREINVLVPRNVLLNASFVYFCHHENFYMNKHTNTVDTAYRFVEACKGRPVALYPGDHWEVAEAHDSSEALRRYAADHERALANPLLVEPANVGEAKLVEEALRFLETLCKHNSNVLLRKLPPARIYLTDCDTTVELSLRGLRTIQHDHDSCDISLSSGVLLYCFRFGWGGETLTINGRFRAPPKGNMYNFFHWFSIARANDQGEYYNLGYYVRKVVAKGLNLVSGYFSTRSY